MRRSICIALFGMFHGLACLASETGKARFINEDMLEGRLASLGSGELLWQSPMLAEPGRFPFKSLLEIEHPAKEQDMDLVRDASVKLTNGDIIRGKLQAASDESLTLETAFCGRISLNRLMVESVAIEVTARSLYVGPTSMDGWIQAKSEKPAWTYSNRSLVSNRSGSIGRAKLLPEECIVGFDVAWKGESIDLRIGLFSDVREDEDSDTGYELSLQRGSVYLRTGENRRFIDGAAMVAELRENDRAHIELRISSKSGKVCLFVDGKAIRIWQDDQLAETMFGDGLRFHTNSPEPTRLSNLSVSPWDGEVEDIQIPPGQGMMRFGGFEDDQLLNEKPKSSGEQDGRMQLANGDSIDGEVLEVKDGTIRIKTSLGEVMLPISRLKNLALKKVSLERAIRRNGDVRASFPDGTTMVFRLDQFENGILLGTSQNFGEIRIPADSVSRIEFNIYDKKLESLRGGEAW